jgi:hypothetical protein
MKLSVINPTKLTPACVTSKHLEYEKDYCDDKVITSSMSQNSSGISSFVATYTQEL